MNPVGSDIATNPAAATKVDSARADRGFTPAGATIHWNLKSAHGTKVERPNYGKLHVGEAELCLPHWQKRIELICVTIMQDVHQTSAQKTAGFIARRPLTGGLFS